ncbi:hypothetical protein Tco_1541521 [Tanacetum coccineum]
MTQEEMENQKGIKQAVKADVAKFKIKKGKKYLIDILGQNVVDKVYKDKVKVNGPISLKMYRDNGSDEIINNFKISELYLRELRKVMQACPKRTGAGWNTIYTQMRKRKNADNLNDYFNSTKRYMKSVQFGDFQAGTVLNEPTLGMILFNSKHRQDFISIDDFEELNNDMLYNVQEIFFRLHQGPLINDLSRIFNSFLVAKVDKRNLNLNKQMRLIKQLSDAKLNDAALLLEAKTKCFTSRRFTRSD